MSPIPFTTGCNAASFRYGVNPVKILIAAGGSGGHIFPAVALARKLKEMRPDTDILFVGSNKTLDRSIFEKELLRYSLLSANKLPYRMSPKVLLFLLKLKLDCLKSFYLVAMYRPDAMVGFGGYVSSAVSLASFLFRVPIVAHEQNVVPGRANAFLFKWASRIAISFTQTESFIPKHLPKAVFTGSPVRATGANRNKAESLKEFGFVQDKFTILLIGGSQGAHSLNEKFAEAVTGMSEAIKASLQIIHITGIKDYTWIAEKYEKAALEARVYSFIDRIEDAYTVSDLIITRSGASALFEIALFEKPMILVPYPYAMSHQSENARAFSAKGAAVEIAESDLSTELLKSEISRLMNDRAALDNLAAAASRLKTPEAADNLANLVLGLTGLYHFVGIGGIGMSGIALILLKMGYRVSGSDTELNKLTSKIESSGGNVYKGHKRGNIKSGTQIVVYSSSIPKDNPELVEAGRRRIPIIQRAELLAELFNKKKGIAVTGTHGKTTTTSLISVMLEKLNYDPTAVIGGEINLFGGNAKYGRGEYFVAEADESDGSFRYFRPLYSIITNAEMEHMDYYKTLDDIFRAYSGFANNTRDSGAIFYNCDDANLRAIAGDFKKECACFGFSEEADIHAIDITMDKFRTAYGCVYKGRVLGRVELNIPGRHNVLNSLAAVLVGLRMGLDFPGIARSISDFNGTKRRFHLRADVGGVMLIDDYAHHPTEIRAVLDACRGWNPGRVIAVFQPHRYTRTLYLQDAFGSCFTGADVVILTDIYAASEPPIEGVSVKNIYNKIKSNGISDVTIVRKEEITRHVMKIKKPGDMILVLGAGDIKETADELSERLNNERV